MYLVILFSIAFLISPSCLAKIYQNENNLIFQNDSIQKCQNIGGHCQIDTDCCSDLNCYSSSEKNICLPLTFNMRSKHNADDFVIPPYYNPSNQLYPYGVSKPALPFYKAKDWKQNFDRKNMEWDHCQFHEDCGEGNCCNVHFRFRSLPKWFCRPNREYIGELCTPLTRYRSLKDIPARKQLQNKFNS